MRIVKVEHFRGSRSYEYEVSDEQLKSFGGEGAVRKKLKKEDSEVIEWLEQDICGELFKDDEYNDGTEWSVDGD